jgi:preprotein translocase subunit SecD
VLDKKAESFAGDIRTGLRDKKVRGSAVNRNGQTVEITLRDAASLEIARRMIQDQMPDLSTVDSQQGSDSRIVASIKPEAARRFQDAALKQNVTTLHNRINELGVAEPVIQQQGLDRIVVQLPGVQDTAKAKDHHGPHRHARDAPGGRKHRRPRGRTAARTGAVRLREIPRPLRAAP